MDYLLAVKELFDLPPPTIVGLIIIAKSTAPLNFDRAQYLLLILSLDITVLEKLGGLTSVHHLALLD
jgi:hypothetical protein